MNTSIKYILLFSILLFTNCKASKRTIKQPEIIVYRFTDDVEKLLLNVIKKETNIHYGLLIKEQNELITISLVKKLSFFHNKTSYRALIGNKLYPISFSQFDMRFGVTEDVDELLKRKRMNKGNQNFLTKKSYPLYHSLYTITLDKNNNIINAQYIY